jgi:hypothetical protein
MNLDMAMVLFIGPVPNLALYFGKFLPSFLLVVPFFSVFHRRLPWWSQKSRVHRQRRFLIEAICLTSFQRKIPEGPGPPQAPG